MNRFSIWYVLRGHWKSLDRRPDESRKKSPKILFVGLPGTLLALALIFRWELSSPAALLTAVSILIGGALTVFAQLVNLRSRIREDLDEAWVAQEKGAVDETVNHLLTAVLFAILDAVLLVTYMNVIPQADLAKRATAHWSAQEWLQGALQFNWHWPSWESIFTALISATSAYLVLLLLVCIPRLYNAYTTGFKVDKSLDGHQHTLRR